MPHFQDQMNNCLPYIIHHSVFLPELRYYYTIVSIIVPMSGPFVRLQTNGYPIVLQNFYVGRIIT